MKSRRCAECNVSSARFAWGFALLARDGWALTAERGVAEDDWLCPTCSAQSRDAAPEVAKTASEGQRPSDCSSSDKLRVLLVDDEELVRRCTARSLASFEIVTASGGAEALAILSGDADFDAVLSDVMMPCMTGPEFFERCYDRYPELAQHFVFASGDPSTARRQLLRAVQRVGADRVPILLAKPSSREELRHALCAAAAHKSAHSGSWAIAQTVPGVKKYRG
jgi:CheY-like chemotaxis protein